MLRRLIRKALIRGDLDKLMKMIWDEHANIFYEDNAATRRSHIMEMIP